RFGEQVVWDVDHIQDGSDAHAYVRPHDVRMSSSRSNDSVAATLKRVNNLGWISKLHLRLSDGQVVIAHVPNEALGVHEPGDDVWVDLRNAKIFKPEEKIAATADGAG